MQYIVQIEVEKPAESSSGNERLLQTCRRDRAQAQFKEHRSKTPEDIWEDDLNGLEQAMDALENGGSFAKDYFGPTLLPETVSRAVDSDIVPLPHHSHGNSGAQESGESFLRSSKEEDSVTIAPIAHEIQTPSTALAHGNLPRRKRPPQAAQENQLSGIKKLALPVFVSIASEGRDANAIPAVGNSPAVEKRNHAFVIPVPSPFPGGVRLFRCSVCERAFRYISECKRHTVVHTGEKPLKCSTCLISFNRPSALKRHIESKRHKKGREAAGPSADGGNN